MKKYYIGLAILMVLTLALVGVTISMGDAAKADRETTKKLQTVSQKLDEYVSRNSTIPEDLKQLDVADVPPSINYKKLDDTKYRLCVTFKQSSNAFGGGWLALFGGFAAYSAEGGGDDTPKTYYDSFIIYSHEKGENCQTVEPYTFDTKFQDESQIDETQYFDTTQQTEI